MRVAVIGARGHIGTYLVPQLTRAGCDVIAISRTSAQPYEPDKAWQKAKSVFMDRSDVNFTNALAEMGADTVIDLVNFDFKDTRAMAQLVRSGKIAHYIYCSSIWSHGRAQFLPLRADLDDKEPLCDYGCDKFTSERYLTECFTRENLPVSVISPGQICGRGWKIINPWGNLDLRIFADIYAGRGITLPNFGMETLHLVHASDVARCFLAAVLHREAALGGHFNAVATHSMTTYGYAKFLFELFGHEPKIAFSDWNEWKKSQVSEAFVEHSYLHLARSGSFDLSNAAQIGYVPQFSIQEVIKDAMAGYLERGWLN